MSVGTDQLVLELTPLQDRVDYVLRWIRQDGDVLELPNRVHVSWQPANLGGLRASLRCSVPGFRAAASSFGMRIPPVGAVRVGRAGGRRPVKA
jgi:hypothetical protein